MANPKPPAGTMDAGTARMLLDRARQARAQAYAPYSGFTVGAALLTEEGDVVTGCNVENASYGLSNCAERTALFKAVSEGRRRFAAVAVVGTRDDAPCAPCGACRQVLYEFGPDMLFVTPTDGDGGYSVTPMRELLPGAFDPARLEDR
jgi:cytidine deaminase